MFDVKKRRLDMEVSAAQIKKRLKAWKAPKSRYRTGVLAKTRGSCPPRPRAR